MILLNWNLVSSFRRVQFYSYFPTETGLQIKKRRKMYLINYGKIGRTPTTKRNRSVEDMFTKFFSILIKNYKWQRRATNYRQQLTERSAGSV